jgi:hypothetical protein
VSRSPRRLFVSCLPCNHRVRPPHMRVLAAIAARNRAGRGLHRGPDDDAMSNPVMDGLFRPDVAFRDVAQTDAPRQVQDFSRVSRAVEVGTGAAEHGRARGRPPGSIAQSFPRHPCDATSAKTQRQRPVRFLAKRAAFSAHTTFCVAPGGDQGSTIWRMT